MKLPHIYGCAAAITLFHLSLLAVIWKIPHHILEVSFVRLRRELDWADWSCSDESVHCSSPLLSDKLKPYALPLKLIRISLLWHSESRSNWKAFKFLSKTYCGRSLAGSDDTQLQLHICLHADICVRLYVLNMPKFSASTPILTSCTLWPSLIFDLLSKGSLSAVAQQTSSSCSRFGPGVTQC